LKKSQNWSVMILPHKSGGSRILYVEVVEDNWLMAIAETTTVLSIHPSGRMIAKGAGIAKDLANVLQVQRALCAVPCLAISV